MSAASVGALDGAQEVDDPLGVRLLRADLGEVGRTQVGDDEAPAVVDLRPLERAREQLELRELDRLVDGAEHAVRRRRPASTQLGGEPSAFGVVFEYWKRPVSVTIAM